MRLHHHQLQAPRSSPTKGPPPPRVVLRVPAVIEVPGKGKVAEEGYFDLDAERLPDAGVLLYTNAHLWWRHETVQVQWRSLHRSEACIWITLMNGRKLRRMRPMMENTWTKGRLRARWVRSQCLGRLPQGRKSVCHEPDEEDNELMMYANLKVLPHSHFPLAPPFLTQSNQDDPPPLKVQGYFRMEGCLSHYLVPEQHSQMLLNRHQG